MKKDNAYGVIVFYESEGEVEFLVVKQIQGHYSFPKGHAEKGESKLETALRELEEETGIREVNLLTNNPLVKDEYIIAGKEIHKEVEFYIGRVRNKNVIMQEGEIFEYRWIKENQGEETFTFESSRRILKTASNIIKEYLSK